MMVLDRVYDIIKFNNLFFVCILRKGICKNVRKFIIYKYMKELLYVYIKKMVLYRFGVIFF